MTERLTSLRPMLAVTDLERTMAFYRDRLGFRCTSTFGDPPVWCEMARGGVTIMFNAPPRESVVRDVPRKSRDYQIYYIEVDDVAATRAELLERGAEPGEPRVTIYGMREFEVRDPDGIWLWFAEPTDDPPAEVE